VSIANRRGSVVVSHDNGGSESKRTSGHAAVSSSVVSRTKTWRKSLDLTGDGVDDDDVITPPTAVDDIESPRTPKYFPRELSLASNRLGGGLHHTGRSNGLPDHLITPLLPATLRGGGGGGAGGRVKSGSSSIGNLSTPYSTLSGISNYEYEDDFTSEEEDEGEENLRFSSHRRSSSRPSSRIPISRSSSLHRRKNLLRNGNTSGAPAAMVAAAAAVAGSAQRPRAASPPLEPPPSSFVQGGRVKHSPVASPRDDRRRDSLIVTEYEVQEKTPPTVDRDSEYPALSSQPSAVLNRSRRKRTQSVPPGSQAARNNLTVIGGSGENVSGAPLAAAKSAIELSSVAAAQLAAESDPTSSALVSLPQTEPPTRRYNHSISVPGEKFSG
jgi:hypothetical protein